MTQSTPTRAEEIAARITDWLSKGGLFNPDLMEKQKTTDLMLDIREVLSALVADAERWQVFCNLWAASTEMLVKQDEDGSWSIRQIESVENEAFFPLIGETPDAAIDKEMEKP